MNMTDVAVLNPATSDIHPGDSSSSIDFAALQLDPSLTFARLTTHTAVMSLEVAVLDAESLDPPKPVIAVDGDQLMHSDPAPDDASASSAASLSPSSRIVYMEIRSYHFSMGSGFSLVNMARQEFYTIHEKRRHIQVFDTRTLGAHPKPQPFRKIKPQVKLRIDCMAENVRGDSFFVSGNAYVDGDSYVFRLHRLTGAVLGCCEAFGVPWLMVVDSTTQRLFMIYDWRETIVLNFQLEEIARLKPPPPHEPFEFLSSVISAKVDEDSSLLLLGRESDDARTCQIFAWDTRTLNYLYSFDPQAAAATAYPADSQPLQFGGDSGLMTDAKSQQRLLLLRESTRSAPGRLHAFTLRGEYFGRCDTEVHWFFRTDALSDVVWNPPPVKFE